MWKRPAPLAQVELVRGFGGVVAPLLAGFSLTAIVALLTASGTPREGEWAVVAFALSAASLLSAMRYSFLALRHSASPAERLGWFPEATVEEESLQLERRNQAGDMIMAHFYSTIAERLYDLGQLSFLSGLVLLLIPDKWDPARVAAVGIAIAATAIELLLLVADLLGKSPRYLTITRSQVSSQVEDRLSELDDVSRRSVLRSQ